MASTSFAMTHIANLGDLQKNKEVCQLIDQKLETVLVNRDQYNVMIKNLEPKHSTAMIDTITELLFLTLGQSDRAKIELSIPNEYYCKASYKDIFGEEFEGEDK